MEERLKASLRRVLEAADNYTKATKDIIGENQQPRDIPEYKEWAKAYLEAKALLKELDQQPETTVASL